MIADRAGIVSDHGHRFVFNFAFVKVEVGRALQNVAGVNQKRIRIFLADALDQSRASRHAAFTGIVLIVLKNGIDLRVRVVRVQNCDQGFAGERLEQRRGNGPGRIAPAKD